MSLGWHIMQAALVDQATKTIRSMDKKSQLFKMQRDAVAYMTWGEAIETMALGKIMLSLYVFITLIDI
jgi:hypothetical protein